MNNLFLILLLALVGVSCMQQEGSSPETRDIVMTTDLKNDPELIAKYRHYHSNEGVWPEIIKANQESGIKSVKIYLQGTRLMMVITVPADMDMDEMDRKYVASSSRIAEWGQLMNQMQTPPPGADSGQVWVPMELIHSYEGGEIH